MMAQSPPAPPRMSGHSPRSPGRMVTATAPPPRQISPKVSASQGRPGLSVLCGTGPGDSLAPTVSQRAGSLPHSPPWGRERAPGWLLGSASPGCRPLKGQGWLPEGGRWQSPQKHSGGGTKVRSVLVPSQGTDLVARSPRSWYPELGARGLGGLVGLKAPSIIEVFLSVSYYSLGTNSGLSAIHGTKKRQGWCQIAYCLKCRLFFFSSK